MRLDTKVVKDYFSPPTPPTRDSYPHSPTLAIPKQIRRSLPAILAVFFLFFLFSGSVGGGSSRAPLFHAKQKYSEFPKKIWQTWKVDPLGFEERDSSVAKTWIQKNPNFRYEVLTDQNDMAYVDWHFGPENLNRPEIVYMYKQLTARIIKADLLRYMIMYVEGGVYTDIDVEALRPINKFIPDRWNEKDVDMIVGVEIDQPEFANHTILGQKCMSFVQWTFICKPRLPVMMTLIEYIMDWLKQVAKEQRVPISEIKLDFDQVITGTGPTAFTRAIMHEMEKREGHRISWDMFHGLQESKLVGGVLVLTVEAFAAGQGHSDSGTHEGKHSLVRHHYHASKWPTAHPRLKHPVYKEVEQCNWEMECVEKWDEDVKNFETLPQEEKERLIRETEEEDARRDEEEKQKEEEDRLQKEQEDNDRRWQEEREIAERVFSEEQRMAAERAELETQQYQQGLQEHGGVPPPAPEQHQEYHQESAGAPPSTEQSGLEHVPELRGPHYVDSPPEAPASEEHHYSDDISSHHSSSPNHEQPMGEFGGPPTLDGVAGTAHDSGYPEPPSSF